MASGGESVVAGQVKQGASNSTLLPAGFLQALGLDAGELPPRQAVRLADNKLEAYRYANLRPRGLDKPVTLFTVPTSAGVATVACVDPSADCESIANTLKLNARDGVPGRAEQGVRERRWARRSAGSTRRCKSGRKALRSAKTPKAQAAAAKGLSSAYKDAVGLGLEARGLARPTRAANQQLASALKQTGDAYGKLASAASSGNKCAYSRRAARCRARRQRSPGALRRLEAAGYKIAS